jgi:lmo0469 protein
MKIVILGNGFDLANGLPTKYEDYFNYNEENIKNQFEQISNFFTCSCPSIFREKQENHSLKEDEKNTNITIKNIFKYDISMILQSCIDNSISIWDLYFWNSRKNIEHTNWADVEGNISYIINNIEIFTFLSSYNDISQYKLNDIYEGYCHFISNTVVRKGLKPCNKSTEEYLTNIYNDIDGNKRFKLLCTELLCTRYKLDNDEAYLYIIKKELELFEDNFKKYMTDEIKNIINANKGIYRNNLFAVTKKSNTDIYILNFNYTDFSGEQSKDKRNTRMQRNLNRIKIKQNNVHGTYYSKIIFGIDQTNIANENFFQFTKTYRKMELDDEISAVKLPDSASKIVDEIIFFGHSLSEADYSYFHSIFDYYDIYGSNIKLIFKYSTGRCKNEYVKKIMKLLKFYGEKMFDKSRGNNLVHKLILENRLSIKDVELEKINIPS